MKTDNFVNEMYSIVDAKDGAALAAMMTEDAIFRFANMPHVEGREGITSFLDTFYRSIKNIRHEQIEDWQLGDIRFATGIVNYTRHNNTVLRVPFAVKLKMQGRLISEYLIFVDASQLYT
ncbi:MAG: nuclear transport factor 2 family protein [Bacteroidales bacterium]|nr:nuclear transport factor 2 family protein [Bacteroidales bacterium]